MSIILDALRKSEAARRRNEAPALFDAMPTAVAPERTRPTWPLWAIGVIGIAALALALWLVLRASPQADTRAIVTDTARTEADVQQTNVEPATATATAIDPTQNATPTAQAIMPTDASPPAPRDVAEAPAPLPPPNIASVPVPPASETIAEPTRNPVVQNSMAPSIETPARPEPAPNNAFRSPQSDGPLALADLDADTRKQLPPLKLSMHMWHETPAKRFVILDGQRLREGDVLGDIVIERITRDGAALSWRGSALKIDWR